MDPRKPPHSHGGTNCHKTQARQVFAGGTFILFEPISLFGTRSHAFYYTLVSGIHLCYTAVSLIVHACWCAMDTTRVPA